MTNRPSEILRPLWAAEEAEFLRACDFEQPTAKETIAYRDAVFALWDDFAARLESLERDRERQGKLLGAVAEWLVIAYPAIAPQHKAARVFLADSPPLSSEAKSATSRGVRFYKRTFPDGSWSVFAIDTAGKLWFCLEDGDIRLVVSQAQAKDYTDNPIPYSEAVALRPAIATRWAEPVAEVFAPCVLPPKTHINDPDISGATGSGREIPIRSPQSEWPKWVRYKSMGQAQIMRVQKDGSGMCWATWGETGPIQMGTGGGWLGSLFIGGTQPGNFTEVTHEQAVREYPDIAKLHPLPPPVQSEQPGKHEGGEGEASGKVGKHECSWCGRRHSNGWHCASEVAAIKAEAIDWKKRCIKRGQELTEAGHRIATLEAELASKSAEVDCYVEDLNGERAWYRRVPCGEKFDAVRFFVKCDPPKGVPG